MLPIVNCQLNEMNARFQTDTYGFMAAATVFLATPRTANIPELVKTVNAAGNVFGVTVKEHQLASFWTLSISKKAGEIHLTR